MPVRLLAQVPTDSQPQLGLTEPPPYQVGQVLDLFGAFVSGPADALDAVLTVTATSGITFLSVTAIHPTQPLSCVLDNPQQVTCTRDVVRGSTEIFVSMRFDAPGDHTLTATVSQSNPDPNPGNNTLAGTITVEGGTPTPGAISGTKWHDQDQDGTRDGGEPGLAGWTIYVDENGNEDLDDGEPSATTGSDGSYQIDDLEPDTYTVREVLQEGWQQTFPAGGAHTVTVNEGSTTTGIDFGNVEVPGMADLGLTLNAAASKAQVPTVPVGEDVDVSVTLTNDGPDAGENVTVTVTAPDFGEVDPGSLTPFTPQGSVEQNGNAIIFIEPSVDNAEQFEVTIRWRSQEPGEATFGGTVVATTDDPDPGNNTSQTMVTVVEEPMTLADLVVKKIVTPDTVFVGDTLTYTVSILNVGPDDATNVQFLDLVSTDSLDFIPTSAPAGCTIVQSAGRLTCTIGSISVGQTASVSYQARAKAVGTVTNFIASLTSDLPDPDPTDNAASVKAFVRGGADVSVEKTAAIDGTTADTVAVGAVITYTVIVTNNGPEIAFLVETDDLVFADSLEFITDSVPLNCDLGTAIDDDTGLPLSTMHCRVEAILDVGESQSVTYQARAKTVGTVSNQVEVKPANRDLNPSNNIAIVNTVVEAEAMTDLSIEKTVETGPGRVLVGDTLHYTVTVTNNGPSRAGIVVVKDVVASDSLELLEPSGALCQTEVSTDGARRTKSLTCALAPNGAQGLDVGQSGTLSYKAVAKRAGPITNMATTTPSIPDFRPENNTAKVTTVVEAETTIDFTLDASASTNTAQVGDEVTFTFSCTPDQPAGSCRVTATSDDSWTNPVLGTGLFVARGDTMSAAGKDTMIVEVDPEGQPAGTTRITYEFTGGFSEAGETYTSTFTLKADKENPNASIFFEASAPRNDDPDEDDDIIEILVNIDALATAVEQDPGGEVPAAFHLYGNYPNPFNPETTIRFDLKEQASVRLQVFNALGQAVETLVDEVMVPGTYRAVFDARGLPSGSYFYRLEAGGFSKTRPMVLLK